MADVKPLVQAGGSVKEMAAADRVVGHVISVDIKQLVVLTQAAYDLLSPPDPDTAYFIVG